MARKLEGKVNKILHELYEEEVLPLMAEYFEPRSVPGIHTEMINDEICDVEEK